MDIERFQAQLDSPRHSQADLVTMRENVLRRNANGHRHAAEVTLDRRFPGWRTVKSRRGGAKATHVEFQGRKEHFDSEKDAYVWLLERFIQHYPKPFVELDRETLYLAKGQRKLYFAKSLQRLFGEDGQHLAADPNMWCRLSNGWYAKLVLSELQKVALLTKFSTLARLRFGADWDWNGEGGALPQQSADELLQELQSI